MSSNDNPTDRNSEPMEYESQPESSQQHAQNDERSGTEGEASLVASGDQCRGMDIDQTPEHSSNHQGQSASNQEEPSTETFDAPQSETNKPETSSVEEKENNNDRLPADINKHNSQTNDDARQSIDSADVDKMDATNNQTVYQGDHLNDRSNNESKLNERTSSNSLAHSLICCSFLHCSDAILENRPRE